MMRGGCYLHEDQEGDEEEAAAKGVPRRVAEEDRAGDHLRPRLAGEHLEHAEEGAREGAEVLLPEGEAAHRVRGRGDGAVSVATWTGVRCRGTSEA